MAQYNYLNQKAFNAAKWSTITEIIAKIANPISNMILARILAPEAFGVVATTTMIFSFAEMLTDAGFQKYLVQHQFKDEQEKKQKCQCGILDKSMVIYGDFWIDCTSK